MTHDPLCPYTPGQPGFGGLNSGVDSTRPFIPGVPCQCDLIAKVREDILAKCIAVVEPLTNKMDHPWATVGDALAALRALEEKP